MKARVITAEQYKQYLQYTTEESWLLLLAGDPLPFAEGQGEGRERGTDEDEGRRGSEEKRKKRMPCC